MWQLNSLKSLLCFNDSIKNTLNHWHPTICNFFTLGTKWNIQLWFCLLKNAEFYLFAYCLWCCFVSWVVHIWLLYDMYYKRAHFSLSFSVVLIEWVQAAHFQGQDDPDHQVWNKGYQSKYLVLSVKVTKTTQKGNLHKFIDKHNA